MPSADNSPPSDSSGKPTKSKHWARRVVWTFFSILLLAGVGAVGVSPYLCLPGQNAIVLECCVNSINGMKISPSITDEDTVTIQIGREVLGVAEELNVGDSVRGPWWWGRLTVVRIDPDMERVNWAPPAYCDEKPERPELLPTPCSRSSQTAWEQCIKERDEALVALSIPSECSPKDGGGGSVTVRWTPW